MVLKRMHCDLGVGHNNSLVGGVYHTLGVGEFGIQRNPRTSSGSSPLHFQVLSGNHDDDALDDPARQQLTGDTQGEGRLTCARCRHCKEVLGVSRQVFVEGLLLPFTKPAHLRRRDL